MSTRFKALISYEGTNRCGWQKQTRVTSKKVLPSIQEEIEEALFKITRERAKVVGSGRTDAGVHASGQVAHFDLKNRKDGPWSPEVLLPALNSKLPSKIRLLEIEATTSAFHAQKSATKKQYSYYIQEGPSAIAGLLPHSFWHRKRLDEKSMNQAANFLVGEHDFKAFQASGSSVKSSVREIFSTHFKEIPFAPPWNAEHLPEGFRLLRFQVVGSGFLKQMVRSIVGTLVEIGRGARPPESMKEILQTRDRTKIGATAPSHGLWLEKVWYFD